MLVLNTNEWWWMYYLANEYLWKYPDFKNNFICVPYRSSFWWASWAEWIVWTWIQQKEYVKSVNWTYINSRIWSLAEPYYRVQDWADTNIYMQQTWWNNNDYQRIWFQKPMSWWEIIWKEIVWWIHRIHFFWTTSWTPTSSCKFSYVVKLLHTDWTLTTIWSLSREVNAQQMTASTDFFNTPQKWQIKQYSWSWVVAQAWDYLVVDFEVESYCSTTYSSTAQRNTVIGFWLQWSYTPSNRIRPLQISIW